MNDYYILYEERAVCGKIKKTIFGYTTDSDIAMSELKRLYHIDPFQTKSRYSIEMEQYKPTIGYELKKS